MMQVEEKERSIDVKDLQTEYDRVKREIDREAQRY
ncbi:hypothetical protein SAMN00120144_4212 [Hymenobacter roseosalivarius DSM 11622]|uniref:Uncharacterized protein n=1 Tax=Hymenobacter roseosalivarius DSM 11622 TaxID=645990 RepID=A0A1W1UIC5_9BACT|nr:hypothetical protein SAMN00120144_4212 [Hymenobacter roseosalivarius DSM 11622]